MNGHNITGPRRFKICSAWAAVIILAAIMMLAACGEKQSTAGDEDTRQGEEKSAAEQQEENTESESQVLEDIFGIFASETLEGTAVTQDVFEESDLTMVNIWGTFCGPCIREMPELGEISREYEEKDFRIIGMLCDVYESGDETALEIVEATQADYMHIVASKDLQNGILGQVQAVPTTIFVDSSGNQVGEIYTGARDKESWLEIIEEIRKRGAAEDE